MTVYVSVCETKVRGKPKIKLFLNECIALEKANFPIFLFIYLKKGSYLLMIRCLCSVCVHASSVEFTSLNFFFQNQHIFVQKSEQLDPIYIKVLRIEFRKIV